MADDPDSSSLESVRLDPDSGGGGGGGGAVTIADGADASTGSVADAESASGNGSVIAILKRLRTLLAGGLPAALGAGGGVKVDGSGTALPVSGSVTISDGSGPVTVDGTVDTELPAAAALADAAANATTPTVGAANLLFNGSNWDRVRGDTTNGVDVDVTRLPNAATPSQSSVSSSASSVTVLASNSARKGATVYNDSSAILYLKLGATASTSSHTVQIAAGGYYEVPFGYTGIIDGIWASANGSARVTELT